MSLRTLSVLVLTASAAIAQTSVKDARYLPCRVDAPTNLIFPSSTRITSAVASSDAVQVSFKAGESTMQVVAKAQGEGARLVITTTEGSTYTYQVRHEVLNGADCGAINYSVWPLNDDQIKTAFEGELLQAIAAAPVKHYKIAYSSREPGFSVKPAVGFDGMRSAFVVEDVVNAAVMVYAGTKDDHVPAQTVPLKFERKVWLADRVANHWFIRHEEEWATIDVQ